MTFYLELPHGLQDAGPGSEQTPESQEETRYNFLGLLRAPAFSETVGQCKAIALSVCEKRLDVGLHIPAPLTWFTWLSPSHQPREA
jgi:hypothetical protein